LRANRGLWGLVALLCSGLCAAAAGTAADPVQLLLQQAEFYERQAEWEKACEGYASALRLQRGASDVRERYQHCLRRLWQVRRHRDPSYRKEVLGLDYGQALRVYSIVRDTLLEHALEKRKVDAGKLFRKGLDELDAALADPAFCLQYLADAKPAELQAFRALLMKTWGDVRGVSRPEALRQLRELALAAQGYLQLPASVVIMEFACGACYAIDDYTVYLTPSQLSELCHSLKGELLPSVAYYMKTGGVGYLQISGFQETTAQEVDTALAVLTQAGMKALVLDLRGNSGGLFETAVDVARRFLTSGVIASLRHQDPRLDMVYHARNATALTLPVVVLVDGDTASAAEVLAGALKENQRARVLGQATYGKGCTQSVLKLPATGGVPTGGLRLTVARFYSPKGEPYTNRGVLPDLVVERFLSSEAMLGGFDQQLHSAVVELERP
jgi:hypothetical protein